MRRPGRGTLEAVAAIRTIEAEEDGTAPPCVMSSRVTAARQWDGAGAPDVAPQATP